MTPLKHNSGSATATISDLPWDLVEEILCRVPAISLKRLRSSCKRWNCFFNDKEFARKHFHKAPKQPLVFTVTKTYIIYLMSVNFHGVSSVVFRGEHSLLDDSNQVRKVFHCDGLLLFTFYEDPRNMLWNPCTDKTRWIQPVHTSYTTYALGSACRSGNRSYKILSCRGYNVHEFAIYEVNSKSWRILDVIPDFEIFYNGACVSLKGKTYWFASESKDEQPDMFLVSFDYTTERFERLSLPCKCPLGSFQDAAISIVSDEKLAVILLGTNTWRKHIWLTNKIDGTKEVLWRKFLTVDSPKHDFWFIRHFLVDEEKKVAICFVNRVFDCNNTLKRLVYIAGEDRKMKLMDLGEVTLGAIFLDYVPSLVEIPQSGRKIKKNRGD